MGGSGKSVGWEPVPWKSQRHPIWKRPWWPSPGIVAYDGDAGTRDVADQLCNFE